MDDKIKKMIEEICCRYDVELAEIKWKKFNQDKLLEVLIDRNEPIDLDLVTEVSQAISLMLDEQFAELDDYLLDVSSVGLEKPLRTEAALLKAVEDRIHVELINHEAYEGILKQVSEPELIVEIMDKTRKKQIKLQRKDIRKIRKAVKV